MHSSAVVLITSKFGALANHACAADCQLCPARCHDILFIHHLQRSRLVLRRSWHIFSTTSLIRASLLTASPFCFRWPTPVQTQTVAKSSSYGYTVGLTGCACANGVRKDWYEDWHHHHHRRRQNHDHHRRHHTLTAALATAALAASVATAASAATFSTAALAAALTAATFATTTISSSIAKSAILHRRRHHRA